MNKPKLSALRHLTSVFGDQTRVEHLAAALRTAAEHHTELAEHLRTRRDAGHFNGPNSLISHDGAQMLADDHDRRAGTYTELADLVHTALEAHDEEGPR
ncbi:hypothetical protein ACQEVZ_55500 [Dactylosporangium sp. CA-152071]|uniref:hypothetical protein n=1 Tax=Dactylosporangium sp. CA-152071 TaxID=3239933 RepID=UPI003D9029E2